MTGPVFVDTNVFVYRHDSSDPSKQLRAERWIALLAHRRTGRLSYQVLQGAVCDAYATRTSGLRPARGTGDSRGACDLATGGCRPGDAGTRLAPAGPILGFLVGCPHRGRRADHRVQCAADGGSPGWTALRRREGRQSVRVAGSDPRRNTKGVGIVDTVAPSAWSYD